MAESTLPTAERHGLFAAFHYPQYRLLWVSSLASQTSRWMDAVILAWLVLELTNSPFLVGLIGSCRTAGMLLGPFFGTIADRLDRRRLLINSQAILTAISLIVMTLFFTSQLEVWHLFVFALIEGGSFSFDFTARFPTAADMVSEKHISNATSLLFLTMGITSGLGPLIGGSLLGVIKASGSFAIISGGFLISTITLIIMKPVQQKIPANQASAWKNLTDGLRYIRNDQPILALIIIAAILNFFVPPIALTLIPIFARDILEVGASGFGQLMGAMGVGGLIGPLITGAIGHYEKKGRFVLLAAIAWPGVTWIFAASNLFPLSLTLLFFAGIGQWLTWSLIQTLLLQWSTVEMRGRVSGVRAFAIGTLPLGNLLTGAMASNWSAPVVLSINAAASIFVTILVGIWATGLRRRK